MVSLVALSLGSAVALAGAMKITPALRQAAVANCTTDVLRLCATSMFDEERVFTCMAAKRSQLSADCRSIFDEGAKSVRR